ncbi:MAG: DUF6057 family protein [Prevotella sp.]
MTKNKRIQKAIAPLAILLATMAVWTFFQNSYANTFYYKEQNQLFLLTSDYLTTYFQRPAWAACLLGDFLTQFFYYLYAGAAIFSILILILGFSAYKAIWNIFHCRWTALAVALVLMGVETSFNFNPDFRMSSLLCVLGGLISFILYSLMLRRSIMIRLATFLVLSLLCVWMFNFGYLVFFLLFAIAETSLAIRQSENSITASRAGKIFVPVSMVFLLIYYAVRSKYPIDPDTCHTYPGIGNLNLPRYDLENYLEIDNLYYFSRYDELISKVETMQNPLPEVTFYYYLVMARRGLLPHKLRSVKPVNLGTLYEIGPKSTPLEIKMVNELYFALGDMTLAEREALLSCVFSHDNRNVRMIKRLAETNLIAGDNEAAMKYLRILDKTLCYKKWAHANRPGYINPTLKAIQQYAIKDDTIRLSSQGRDILTSLLNANPKNRIALDYLLCTDYLVGARELFVKDMNTYYIPHYGMPTEEMYRALLNNGMKMKSEERK